MKSIYLDHAASTPVHPEVAQRMMNVMTGQYGNASSVHAFGREAKKIVSGARDQIAALLGCQSDELVFTAGGTESDNLAILGMLESLGTKGKHVITSAIEHHAVLHTCHELERQGCEVTYVPVDSTGRVSVEDIVGAIKDNTVLVTIMYGNNEVGTVQPIAEIGEVCRSQELCSTVMLCKLWAQRQSHAATCRWICGASPLTKSTGRRALGLWLSAEDSVYPHACSEGCRRRNVVPEPRIWLE